MQFFYISLTIVKNCATISSRFSSKKKQNTTMKYYVARSSEWVFQHSPHVFLNKKSYLFSRWTSWVTLLLPSILIPWYGSESHFRLTRFQWFPPTTFYSFNYAFTFQNLLKSQLAVSELLFSLSSYSVGLWNWISRCKSNCIYAYCKSEEIKKWRILQNLWTNFLRITLDEGTDIRHLVLLFDDSYMEYFGV